MRGILLVTERGGTMNYIRLTWEGQSCEIDLLLPFAIAVLDLVYDGDYPAMKGDLSGTKLEKGLDTARKLSEQFESVVSPIVYSPIEFPEFVEYLKEAEVSFSQFRHGSFCGYRDKVMSLADKERYEDAQSFLDLMIDAEVDPAATMELKGTLYIEAGEVNKGIEWIRRAIEQNPVLVSAYSTLGQTFYNLGKYAEAAFYWEEELKLSPDHSVTYFMLADAYEHSGDLEKAIGVMKNMIDQDPRNLLTKCRLIQLLDKLGDTEGANRLEKEILESEPAYANDIEVWSRIQFKHGRFSKVKKCVEHFLKESPQLRHLKLLSVVPYVKEKEYSKAAEILDEFSNEELWYFYGKEELFKEFLTESERKACGIV